MAFARVLAVALDIANIIENISSPGYDAKQSECSHNRKHRAELMPALNCKEITGKYKKVLGPLLWPQ
jgi:hypothetical protein